MPNPELIVNGEPPVEELQQPIKPQFSQFPKDLLLYNNPTAQRVMNILNRMPKQVQVPRPVSVFSPVVPSPLQELERDPPFQHDQMALVFQHDQMPLNANAENELLRDSPLR